MSARVGVFAEPCKGRTDEGRHYLERWARSKKTDWRLVYRQIRFRCRYCGSVLTVDSKYRRSP